MTNDDLAVAIPQLGYGLKRLSECYQVAKWYPKRIAKKGRTVGEEVAEGWVLEQTYPTSLSGGLRKIGELALADKLKGADAKRTLETVKETIGLLEKAGM